jgi:hypothetical protein
MNGEYTHCTCCGAELDAIEQVLPRRTLVLVTCKSEACHPAIVWQTLTPGEHRQRCRELADECGSQVAQMEA